MLRAFLLAFALLLSAPAAAQSSAGWEVSGGYATLADRQIDTAFRRGWVAGVAVPLTVWLSIAGEVSDLRATVETFDGDARLATLAALGGFRLSARRKRVSAFVQAVAGDARGRGTLFGETDTQHAFVVQPGIGADVPLRRRLAVRGQVDLRIITGRKSGVDENRQLRLVAALVVCRR